MGPAESKPRQCCGGLQIVTTAEGAACKVPVIRSDTCKLPTHPSTVPSSSNLDASRDFGQLGAGTLIWSAEQHAVGTSSSAGPPLAQSRNQRHRKLSEPTLRDSDLKHGCNVWLTQRQFGPSAEHTPGQCCGSKQNVNVDAGASCTFPVNCFDTCNPRLPNRPSTVPSSPNLDASLRDLRQRSVGRQRSAGTFGSPVEQNVSGASPAASPPLTDAMHLAGRVQGALQQQHQQQQQQPPPQKQAAQWTQTALPRAQPQDRWPLHSAFGELQPVPETGSLSTPSPVPQLSIFVPRRSCPGQNRWRLCAPGSI